MSSPLGAAARDWRLSALQARTVFWLPVFTSMSLLALPAVYSHLGSDARWICRRTLAVMMREDGPVEWAQVMCLALGCAASGGIALRLLATARPAQGSLFVLAALALLVLAGEELSWGQRILGLGTPEWLAAINQQGELNAHNVPDVHALLATPRILLGLWGTFAFLVPRTVLRAGLLGRAAFPPAPPLFLAPYFGVFLAYDLLRATAWSEPSFFLRLMRFGEVPELCVFFGLAAFLVLGWQRLEHAHDNPSLECSVELRRSGRAA